MSEIFYNNLNQNSPDENGSSSNFNDSSPGFNKLYANFKSTHSDGVTRTKISFSKNIPITEGDILYIKTKNDFKNLKELFPTTRTVDYTMKSPATKRTATVKPQEVKKSKQTNILSFFVKK